MSRRPLEASEHKSLVDEVFKPGGGTKVFKSANEFAAGAPKSKRYKRRDFSSVADAAVRETEAKIKLAKTTEDPEGVWSTCETKHLVALYAVMHREVYGELPGELAGDWMAACSATGKLLRDEFEDDKLALVEYLRWTFAREKKAEARRNGKSTWRVGWRHAFMQRSLLTDYRVAIKRMQNKHG